MVSAFYKPHLLLEMRTCLNSLGRHALRLSSGVGASEGVFRVPSVPLGLFVLPFNYAAFTAALRTAQTSSDGRRGGKRGKRATTSP